MDALPRQEMARELAGWLGAMNVTSVGRFNESCVSGQVDELVRVSEGFHEKNIVRVADAVAAQGRRIVAIAGPSSSGKTKPHPSHPSSSSGVHARESRRPWAQSVNSPFVV